MDFTINKQPYDIMLELAEKVKARRKAIGYTQEELAKRSQVSLGSLKRFEQKGEISLKSLLKIAQILRSLDDFEGLFLLNDMIDPKIEKLFE